MSFVYSVEETSKAARGKGEKTSSTKKFKDIENDLEAARERIRRFDELYKKMEAEYRATIAAMQKRIEELEGTKKQLSQMHVSIVFFANFEDSNGNHRDCRSAKRTEITYVLQAKLNEIFSHVENIERRMMCVNNSPTYLHLIEKEWRTLIGTSIFKTHRHI